jgi:hypothetical protein
MDSKLVVNEWFSSQNNITSQVYVDTTKKTIVYNNGELDYPLGSEPSELTIANAPSSTAGVLTVDFSKSVTEVTLNTDITSFNFINLPTNLKTSKTIVIFKQDSSGDRLVSGNFKTQDGVGLDIDYNPYAVSIASFMAANNVTNTTIYGFSNGTNFS